MGHFAGGLQAQLISIRCPLPDLVFLIDTGSVYSVVPASSTAHGAPSGCLIAVNGSNVRTYGTTSLKIDSGHSSAFQWSSIIADTAFAIIGADFLAANNILVDPASRRLLFQLPSAMSLQPSPQSMTQTSDDAQSQSTSMQAEPVEVDSELLHLGNYPFLASTFPDVFKTSNYQQPSKHDTLHYIQTKSPPVKQSPRRLGPDKLEAVRSELTILQKFGIIRPSSSPWGSPVHMVKKSKGAWRVVGDYRCLNQVTIKDSYPIPYINDFTEKMSGANIFSFLDLFKSYHQIYINAEDIEKTAVVTPLGCYEFVRMSMGLTNAVQTFQRFMNSIFSALPFVYVYIDDILVFCKSEAERQAHLKEFFFADSRTLD